MLDVCLALTLAAGPVDSTFMLFAWNSPPVESTTAFRIAEMDTVGLNLLLPASVNTGRRDDNLARLDLARARGMQCIIWDRRFERFLTLSPDSPEGGALLDSIVADYRDDPAFFGYYMGDEPPAEAFPLLEQLSNALRTRDPGHPIWNNLYGRGHYATREAWLAYTDEYAIRIRPAVLCNDQFDFEWTRDRGLYVENAAGLSAVAHARGIPFWGAVQLVEHGPFRALTSGELLWQISTLLVYGARGAGYFTYWTPPPDPAWNWKPAVIDSDGQRTPWFDVLRTLGPRIKGAGGLLSRLAWLGTAHTGSVPPGCTRFQPDAWIQAVGGRVVLGYFEDASDHRVLFLANSDSARAQRITLDLSPGVTACVWQGAEDAPLPDACGSGSNRIDETIDPGGFSIFQLFGGAGPSGNALACTVRPEPASGVVTLAITHVGDRGRVELVDAQGRRVWGRPLPTGATAVEWRGERESGGQAAAGLYFVRVEDARGFTVRRLTWLGAR